MLDRAGSFKAGSLRGRPCLAVPGRLGPGDRSELCDLCQSRVSLLVVTQNVRLCMYNIAIVNSIDPKGNSIVFPLRRCASPPYPRELASMASVVARLDHEFRHQLGPADHTVQLLPAAQIVSQPGSPSPLRPRNPPSLANVRKKSRTFANDPGANFRHRSRRWM